MLVHYNLVLGTWNEREDRACQICGTATARTLVKVRNQESRLCVASARSMRSSQSFSGVGTCSMHVHVLFATLYRGCRPAGCGRWARSTGVLGCQGLLPAA